MKQNMKLSRLLFLVYLFAPVTSLGQTFKTNQSTGESKTTEWILSDLLQSGSDAVRSLGKPEIILSKYGKAIAFNGSTDGIFIDLMPLESLKQFTIEVIMCPSSGGNFEQRYFHCGEVKGNRVLLELRSTQTEWYLDAFVKSGDQQKTLIEPTFLHPLDQWFHLAFIVDHQKQETYVNGVKELESQIEIVPLKGGKTSIGVRQNEQSWFKGAIYKIKISPEVLKIDQFLKY